MKGRLSMLGIIVAVLVIAGSYYIGQRQTDTSHAQTPSSPKQALTPPPPATTFDKSRYSLSDPDSIWLVVNKQRPLQPPTYIPASLIVPDVTLRGNITSSENQIRSDVAGALKTMFAAAAKENISLNVQSAYRSYGFQTSLYNRYVQQQGQAVADTQSARPGYSEHQTGLAADIGGTSQPACNVEACFANTSEGMWLASHAYEYGFIIRYADGQTAVTGYTYEPWHVRYVGVALSRKMHADNVLTLEAFFDLPAAPDYK